jgi:hypothetical protein
MLRTGRDWRLTRAGWRAPGEAAKTKRVAPWYRVPDDWCANRVGSSRRQVGTSAFLVSDAI